MYSHIARSVVLRRRNRTIINLSGNVFMHNELMLPESQIEALPANGWTVQRVNKTFWYQFCNFKHFLKAENSEDSLASSCEEFCISFHVTQYETGLLLELGNEYARNTPGSICQYKEDGLVSRPPTLFTSKRQPMHGTSCPKSKLKSTCLTAKFGSLLVDHTETGEKGQNVISSSVQHPVSLIFAIHVSFIPLPYIRDLAYFDSHTVFQSKQYRYSP